MAYIHLTDDERYPIYEAQVEGLTLTQIARGLERDKSTVSRELRRGRGERGYRPAQAIRKQREGAALSAIGPRVKDAVWAAAQVKLREEWSPEQISSCPLRVSSGSLSRETIYQRAYADKRAGAHRTRFFVARNRDASAMLQDARDATKSPTV